MRRPKLIYLITRAHGLKSHLLTSEDYSSMIKAGSVSEIAERLLKGDYSAEVSKLPAGKVDEYQLEKIFYRKLSERFYFVVKFSTGGIREALETFSRRFEMENIKRIIRAKHSGEGLREGELIFIPREYLLINFPAMIKAKSVKEAVELLRETVYGELITYIPLYEKFRTPVILEAKLDSIYYYGLWNSVQKLPDREDVTDLIGREIDLRNILNTITLKYMEISTELIKETSIGIYHKLSRDVVDLLIYSREVVPDVLFQTYYARVAESARNLIGKGMLAEMESLFMRELYKHASLLTVRRPLGLGYVFSYLYLCEREAKNLVNIVFGKRFKLSEEVIGNLLV